jgi:hypothetical protein
MQTSEGVLVSQPMAKDVKIDAFSLTSYGEVRACVVCVCACVCVFVAPMKAEALSRRLRVPSQPSYPFSLHSTRR